LLKPTGDSAVGTGWTLGSGTAMASNGWDAVNNTPPVGNSDPGADSAQIRNATSNANVNYDATMQSYSAAGIEPDDIIKVIVPVINTAAPSATSPKQGTVGVSSNPAIANVSFGAFYQGSNPASAYPAGWKWAFGTATYNPVVVLGTSPVMRVTQVTSSVRIAMVDFMGMYVEYEPHKKVAPLIRSDAASRASSW
jgi:hypothetical protein